MTPALGSQVIVVRRGWHIDVGFAAEDLRPPLRSIAADLPNSRFILFGFGDMHYLMSKHHGSSSLAAALWPGAGIMLVTGLVQTPQQAFGADHVIELDVASDDATAMQAQVWKSFESHQGRAPVYRAGPYEDSLYYASTLRYSALHTCNTWAAEMLEAGALPVRSAAVLWAGQLWSQARRLQRHPTRSAIPGAPVGSITLPWD
jgi:hypothetical protein